MREICAELESLSRAMILEEFYRNGGVIKKLEIFEDAGRHPKEA